MVSLTPDEIMLDVKPRNMVQFVLSLWTGFRFISSESAGGIGSNFLEICKAQFSSLENQPNDEYTFQTKMDQVDLL